ncbi:MAG: hypothetical protein ABL982_00135 [Vicinamibacterales bacterium]
MAGADDVKGVASRRSIVAIEQGFRDRLAKEEAELGTLEADYQVKYQRQLTRVETLREVVAAMALPDESKG